MNEDRWPPPERRHAQKKYPGQDRRKGYQATDGTPGVNAEEPMDEQEERELAQERGPNPRIPK